MSTAPDIDLTTPFQVGSIRVANRVLAAPMSGVSDFPYRKRTIQAGAGYAVAEMSVASRFDDLDDGLRRKPPEGALHVVQIAGRDALAMAEMARRCAGEGADIIDINMGCPAKKVTGGYAGSALLRESGLALRLIDAVVAAVDVPVTLKTRLGWEAADDCAPKLCARAEDAGIQLVTIHGRTRSQFYKGRADWHAVIRIREATRLPLVVNGDIETHADAIAAMDASGADAVMVGRATYGAPWVIAEILGNTSGLGPKTAEERLQFVAEHYDEMLALYGQERGVRHARKHLGWYLDRFAIDATNAARNRLLREEDPAGVMSSFAEALKERDDRSWRDAA